MKHNIKIFTYLAAVIPMLYACSNDDSAFSTGGGTTTGSIPTAQHITVAATEDPAEVWTGTIMPADSTWQVNHEVEIVVVVGDNQNLRINGGIVNFRTDYGLLSATSCILNQGTCSIKWYSESFATAPTDYFVAITAWMMGEEGYIDVDDSGNFNDGDVLLTDTPEPFVDFDHDGFYTPGFDEMIDVDMSNSYTPEDSLYNGVNCTHSTLCSGTTSIPIFSILYLNMDART